MVLPVGSFCTRSTSAPPQSETTTTEPCAKAEVSATCRLTMPSAVTSSAAPVAKRSVMASLPGARPPAAPSAATSMARPLGDQLAAAEA